jgi:hypothetical protein
LTDYDCYYLFPYGRPDFHALAEFCHAHPHITVCAKTSQIILTRYSYHADDFINEACVLQDVLRGPDAAWPFDVALKFATAELWTQGRFGRRCIRESRRLDQLDVPENLRIMPTGRFDEGLVREAVQAVDWVRWDEFESREEACDACVEKIRGWFERGL